jgi:pseudouridine synthase
MNQASDPESIRLNRFLARAGVGSRRGVEPLIRQGRVAVDGSVVTEPGRRVVPGQTVVTVDGRPVEAPRRWSVYAFHKPAGVVSTLKPQGRQSGLDAYREQAGLSAAVIPVGRLDTDTTGLMLWTDDGALAQALMRPDTGIWKRYGVQLNRAPTRRQFVALEKGELVLDGRPCRPARVVERRREGRQLVLELHEGRNRQIRRMFALLGLRVLDLSRTAVGPVSLGRLKEGCFRRLKPEEVAELRRATGLTH